MIRAAIVGVSGYGRWHLLMAMEQALVGRLQLVGATVINQTEEPVICARLRRQGVPVFAVYEEMLAALAGRVDLVLLPTGLPWHAAMTLAALRVGAHVLVEKPLAVTLQDADAVIAAQKSSGRTVAVGLQDLYVPAVHDIKRRVLAGEIGHLRRIVVRVQWPRAAGYYSRNSWAGRLRLDDLWVLDSPVSNAAAHFLMLAMFWAAKKPDAVAQVTTLAAELYRAHAIESFDTASLRAGTADGAEIFFYGSHAGEADGVPEIRLVGDAGEVVWRYEQDYTLVRRGRPMEKFPVPSQLDTRLSVLEALIARLRGDAAFIVGPEIARAHTRMINALHEFFPIHPIAASHCEPHPSNGDGFCRVQGLDDAFERAVLTSTLFSATGVPWAVPVGARSLADYDSFSGVCAPMAARAVI